MVSNKRLTICFSLQESANRWIYNRWTAKLVMAQVRISTSILEITQEMCVCDFAIPKYLLGFVFETQLSASRNCSYDRLRPVAQRFGICTGSWQKTNCNHRAPAKSLADGLRVDFPSQLFSN